MIELTTYLAYVAACVVVVIVPGPTVTLIIANSMRHGTRTGLANVAGTQAGLALMLLVLALGLGVLVEAIGAVFDIIKLIGAAYLVYLGINLMRAPAPALPGAAAAAPGQRSFFWQGFWVIWTNPKALLFFGAFIPQFIQPAGNITAQTVLLGGTFMVVATVLDGGYAVLAGQARRFLSAHRIRWLQIGSGSALILGAIGLAFSRRAS